VREDAMSWMTCGVHASFTYVDELMYLPMSYPFEK